MPTGNLPPVQPELQLWAAVQGSPSPGAPPRWWGYLGPGGPAPHTPSSRSDRDTEEPQTAEPEFWAAVFTETVTRSNGGLIRAGGFPAGQVGEREEQGLDEIPGRSLLRQLARWAEDAHRLAVPPPAQG